MAGAGAESEAGSSSLRKTALRGSAVIVSAYAAGEALRLGANLIVSRMLSPEIYGLMAIVNTVINGLQMFSDIGLSFSVIQSSRGSDPRFLGTVWSLQIMRGMALWLVALALAPAVAWFYGDSRLGALLGIVSVGTVLTGLRSVSRLEDRRHLRQGWLALVDFGGMLIASLTMIVWAVYDASVWALVAGTLTGSLVATVISHLIPGRRVLPAWDRAAVREISGFAMWVMLSTLMLYLAQQSDRLIFGRLEGIAVLGVYNIAAVLVAPPVIIMNQLGGSILFPALSRARESGRDFQAAYASARRPLVVAGGVLVSGLIACGPALIELLYDPRWHRAGTFLQWLALQTWFRVLSTAPAAALLALGEPKRDALANAVKVASIPVGVASGYWLAGLDGAIAGFVAAEVARWATYAWAARRHGLSAATLDLRASLGMLAAAGVGFAAGGAARAADAPGAAAFLASGVAVVLCWAPAGWRVARRELRELRA